jgi:hypothetical protein
LTVVRRTLAGYAERGVFRAYGDVRSEGGRNYFSFRWHTEVPFELVFDPARRELIFRDLLPGISARSAMYADLKTFLRTRSSRAVPAHRRIDPRKAGLKPRQRAGTVSLIMSLRDEHLEYGVRKAVNVIHELFVEFLRHPMYHGYMVKHFGLDPDV